MRFAAAFVSAAALVSSAMAATTYTVIVGANETLTYTPNTLTNVTVGDTVQFQFVSKNHTVTQSAFATPCTNITSPAPGLDSGFMFIEPNSTTFPVWSITINNASAPLWFHCRQTNPESHCGHGMVFAINPNPAANKTFEAFQALANATLTETTSTSSSSGASGASGATGASNSGTGTGTATGTGATTSHTSGAGRVVASSGLLLAGLAAGLIL